MGFNFGAGASYAAEQAGGLIGKDIDRQADAGIQSRLLQERAAIEKMRDENLSRLRVGEHGQNAETDSKYLPKKTDEEIRKQVEVAKQSPFSQSEAQTRFRR